MRFKMATGCLCDSVSLSLTMPVSVCLPVCLCLKQTTQPLSGLQTSLFWGACVSHQAAMSFQIPSHPEQALLVVSQKCSPPGFR